MGKRSANKAQFIKVPTAKFKEMEEIKALMREHQYLFNLMRKDVQILQFQTLKELDPVIAEKVIKGFVVFEVIDGQYIIRPTKDKASKGREADELIEKEDNAN